MEENNKTDQKKVNIVNEMFFGLEFPTVEAAKQYFLSFFSKLISSETKRINIEIDVDNRLLPCESKEQFYHEDKLSGREKGRIGLFEALVHTILGKNFLQPIEVSISSFVDPVCMSILQHGLASASVKIERDSLDKELDALLNDIQRGDITPALTQAKENMDAQESAYEAMLLGKTLLLDFRLEQNQRVYPQVNYQHLMQVYELLKWSQYTDGCEISVAKELLEIYKLFRQDDFPESFKWKSIEDGSLQQLSWNHFDKKLTALRFRAAYWAGETAQTNELYAKLCGDDCKQLTSEHEIFIMCGDEADPTSAFCRLARKIQSASKCIQKLEKENRKLQNQLTQSRDKISTMVLQTGMRLEAKQSNKPNKRQKTNGSFGAVDSHDSDTEQDTMVGHKP